MSKKHYPYLVLTVAAFLVMALLGACASTGHQLCLNAAASIHNTQEDLLHTKTQIESTMGTLENLVEQTDEDMRQQYKHFVHSLDETKSKKARLEKSSLRMRADGDAYFTAWEQELESFTNPEIRRRSEERRTAALASYQDMLGSVDSIMLGFDPFLSKMDDIKRHLDIDLTAGGIVSITDVVERANGSAKSVQNRIDDALEAMDRVASEMSPQNGLGK